MGIDMGCFLNGDLFLSWSIHKVGDHLRLCIFNLTYTMLHHVALNLMPEILQLCLLIIELILFFLEHRYHVEPDLDFFVL